MLVVPPVKSQESQEGIEKLCETEEDVPKHFFPLGAGPVNMEEVMSKSLKLTQAQQTQLSAIFEKFPSVMNETPGKTTVVEHSITVGDAVTIRQKPYRIPYSQRTVVQQELDKML